MTKEDCPDPGLVMALFLLLLLKKTGIQCSFSCAKIAME